MLLSALLAALFAALAGAEPFDCRGRQGLVEVEECRSTYLNCFKDGTYKVNSCDYLAQEVFVQSLEGCMPRDKAGCPPATTVATTTDEIEGSGEEEFTCFDKVDGFYTLPGNPCTGDYHSCVGGAPYLFHCPAGTFWDQSSISCQFINHVQPCGGEQTTKATSTVPPFSCVDLEDGDHPWYPGVCEVAYANCDEGKATTKICEDNTFYDEDSKQCLLPEYITACGGESTGSTDETTDSTKTTAFPIDCYGKPIGNYADPESDCSPTFYTCSPVGVIRQRCPGITYYDTEKDLCGFYDKVPACAGTPHPTEGTTGGTGSTESTAETSSETTVEETTTEIEPAADTTTPKYPFDCTDRPTGNYPSGLCDNFFYQCFQDRTFKVDCGTSYLRYEPTKDQCLAPANVPGCDMMKPDRPVETEFDPARFCVGRLNGFYIHPAQCDTFVICSDTLAIPFACPEGTVFDDAMTKACHHPSRVSPPCGNKQDGAFSCAGLAAGSHPSPVSCQEYFECDEEGAEQLRTCPVGEAFAAGAAEPTCLPAAAVPGCLPLPNLEAASVCGGAGHDGIFPHPDNCNELVACIFGFPFIIRCWNERPYFNPDTVSCQTDLPDKCA